MSGITSRRRFLQSSTATGAFVLAGCMGILEDDEHPYEIWALDQGTNVGYIYGPSGSDDSDDSSFELIEEIDFPSLDGVTPNDEGNVVPHMVAFSSEYEYAAVACTAAAQTLVFRTDDYELVAAIDTGPGSHFAGFTPDDASIQVDVIGEGAIKRIDVDLDDESFDLVDEIEVTEAAPVADRIDEFQLDDGALRPICHDFADTASYHTLGPGIDHSGVVIVDWESFEVIDAFSPQEVRANCGTIAHPDDDKLYLTAGAPSNHEATGGVGEWYVFDTAEHRPLDTSGDVVDAFTYDEIARSTEGYDAHGFWFTPDNEELWVLNRETDDGLVIDPETDEVIDEIDDYGSAPDILAASPDGEYMFATLRGTTPISGDPHAATGDTPGFSVLDIESREIVEVIQPDGDNDGSDFHGIGVVPK